MEMLRSLRTRSRAGCFSILLLAGLPTAAQPASGPQLASGSEAATRLSVSAMVQPALDDVQHSVSGLNIARWKAPSEVRGVAQQNASSIQSDLTNTLPSLLTQADASPGTVSPSFSVYRNVDALYDVVLRVYETASLAAPENEANALGASLQKLENARRQLGDTILIDSKEHESQLVQLQAALKAATAARAQTPAPKTAIIDDGPAAPAPRKKKKPAARPPASSTGSNQAPSGQNP